MRSNWLEFNFFFRCFLYFALCLVIEFVFLRPMFAAKLAQVKNNTRYSSIVPPFARRFFFSSFHSKYEMELLQFFKKYRTEEQIHERTDPLRVPVMTETILQSARVDDDDGQKPSSGGTLFLLLSFFDSVLWHSIAECSRFEWMVDLFETVVRCGSLLFGTERSALSESVSEWRGCDGQFVAHARDMTRLWTC